MPSVRWAMSWQTPLRSDQASWALVRTPVDPGTYSTVDRTQSATARAASAGGEPDASDDAWAARSASTVVRGVDARVSAKRSTVDGSRNRSQEAAASAAARSVVSTRL